MAEVQVGKAVTDSLLNYEFVFAEDDFFVSLNGPCLPSVCDSFSVNEQGGFVFHQCAGNFVSEPIPQAFVDLVAISKTILFLQFQNGIVADAKALPHTNHRKSH